MDRFHLTGKNIVVTGASSGIGRQCAIDFTKYGANVALVGRNAETLNETRSLCHPSSKVAICPCDLSEPDNIPALVKVINTELGKIDGLLYAAGYEKTLPYLNLTSDVYESIYRLNFVSAMQLVRLLSKKSNRNEGAKFVLISSITSVVGRPGVAAYAASKGALVSAVKTLSVEMGAKGMNINCISPGTVLTPMVQKFMDTLTPEQREQRKQGFPLGLGSPEDISSVAIFLLSDASKWVTGQNIIVDGGYTSL